MEKLDNIKKCWAKCDDMCVKVDDVDKYEVSRGR